MGNENSGRTEKPIDKEELRKLVGMGCTDAEIAAWFGVGTATISRRKLDSEYAGIFQTAKLHVNIAIRRAQVKSALAGNTSMLIWLGKQFLKQSDKMDLTQRKPIEEWTEEELKNAIREQGGDPDAIIAAATSGNGASEATMRH